MNKYQYLLYVIEQFERCDAMTESLTEDLLRFWNKESAFWQLQFKRAVIHAFAGTITLATLPQFSFADLRDLAYESLAHPYLYGDEDGK